MKNPILLVVLAVGAMFAQTAAKSVLGTVTRSSATEIEVKPESSATVVVKIAASTACHAAIKVNTPLQQSKMEWLLDALAKTDCPMSCPHGRPVVLRYSMKEIEKAFHRI